jgi:cell division protein FtsX
MEKRKIKKIAIWSASIFIVLFVVLIIHILMVTKPVVYDNADLQLSRIDFKQDIDSLEANKIKHFVMTLPGIENVAFNDKDEILIYGYRLGQQSSDNVYKKLIEFGNYKAEKYVVSAEQLNTGCPIGKDRSSLSYRFSSYIYKCFN